MGTGDETAWKEEKRARSVLSPGLLRTPGSVIDNQAHPERGNAKSRKEP